MAGLRDRLAGATVLAWDRDHPGLFLVHSLRRLSQIYFSQLDSSQLYDTFFWRRPYWRETAFYGAEFEAARNQPPPSPLLIVGLAAAAAAYYLAVLVGALAGVWLCLRRPLLTGERLRQLLPLLLVAYFSLSAAAVQGADRYHLPCLPFLAMYASVVLSRRFPPLLQQTTDA